MKTTSALPKSAFTPRAKPFAGRWWIAVAAYDFRSVKPFVNASRKYGIDVIWDLFHYGYPEDIDLFSDEFPKLFADYCHAAAKYICAHQEGTCYFTPVNEPSFFAWAAGHVGRFAPHCTNRGFELKVALARGAIAGINAIRAAVPDARIVNVDPLCRVAVPQGRADLQRDEDHFNDVAVFESWDMLAGRLMPELGGSRAHLDIIGINYYPVNQWELGREEQPLADDDPRRVPLRDSDPPRLGSLWRRAAAHRDGAHRRHASGVVAPRGGRSGGIAARRCAAARRVFVSNSRNARMARAGHVDGDGALEHRPRPADALPRIVFADARSAAQGTTPGQIR
jgi:hypothetical protein